MSLAATLRPALAALDPDPPLPEGVPAAVLLPLIDGAEPSLLFTRRTDQVRTHKGEISFPGGVRHTDDPDLLTTALRETREELGVPPEAFDVLGGLPPTPTIVSGFAVRPFVGLLAQRPPIRPNPTEIAEVLELPVAELLRVEREESVPDGTYATMFFYELDGNVVWGVTGRILHGFLELIRSGGAGG